MPDDPTRTRAETDLEEAAETALRAWLTVALAEAVTPSAVNPTIVLSFADLWRDHVDQGIVPIVRRVWRNRFESVAGYPPAVSLVDEYLRMARNRMVRVPDEVAARIHQIVARNITASIPEISALVHGELEYSGTENWPHRATVIARTEAGGAWNGAAWMAHSQSPDAGILVKSWLATDDDRTRLSHRDVDGQTVPLGEPFTVGGFPMQYPLDPRGPANEVIQCRCSLTFAEAAQQLPIAARAIRAKSVPDRRTVAAADDDLSESVVIVALPAEADPVQEIGPEEKHATLLYFGDIGSHGDPDRMRSSRGLLLDVLAVAARQTAPFTADVAGVEPLGDEGARVWMLDSPDLQRLFDDLPDIDSEVHSLYEDADATRYPTYKPHVTIGYIPPGEEDEPDPANDDDRLSDDQLDQASAVQSIGFDRLALWWGDDRFVFNLTGNRAETAAGRHAEFARNWVDECGGLPSLIKRIARHVPGTESIKIATAINAVKKTCATGDVNWPGIQDVNPGYRAEACEAVAQWEALKACARARD